MKKIAIALFLVLVIMNIATTVAMAEESIKVFNMKTGKTILVDLETYVSQVNEKNKADLNKELSFFEESLQDDDIDEDINIFKDEDEDESTEDFLKDMFSETSLEEVRKSQTANILSGDALDEYKAKLLEEKELQEAGYVSDKVTEKALSEGVEAYDNAGKSSDEEAAIILAPEKALVEEHLAADRNATWEEKMAKKKAEKYAKESRGTAGQ